MGSYRIAALPGDGIGPEVLESALHVLNRITATTPGLELQITSYEAGANLYRKSGETLPKDVLDACLAAEGVLLAAIGLPDVRKADGTEVQPEMMMGLRRALNVYAAVRPVKLYPGVASPLRTADAGIDMVIIRENLEVFGQRSCSNMPREIATPAACDDTHTDPCSDTGDGDGAIVCLGDHGQRLSQPKTKDRLFELLAPHCIGIPQNQGLGNKILQLQVWLLGKPVLGWQYG